MKKRFFILFLVVVLFQVLLAQTKNAGNVLNYTESDNDRVTTSVDINPATHAQLTMSAWVYPVTGTTYRHQVLSHDDGGYDRSLLRENDSWGVFTGSECWLPGAAVDYNQWQHIAVVYSSTNIRFYKDGVEYSYGNAGSCGSSGYNLMIGYNPGFGEYFNGKIDEIRIWSTALSQATIQDWMHKSLDNTHPNWANLVAYWECDEGSGQTISDSSGNGNTGTLGTSTSVEAEDPAWEASDAPLPVILSDFYAEFSADELMILWTTQSEINLNGWNVYKANSNNLDNAITINSKLIRAEGTSTQSHTYKFVDTDSNAGETYYYWLESIDNSGFSTFSHPISYTVPENNNPDSPEINNLYGLKQNYPNPFNPSTEIKFRLEDSSNVKLEVYNFKGEKVVMLFNGFVEADKEISKVWDASAVTSGVYFYKLTTNKKVFTKKMVLMK